MYKNRFNYLVVGYFGISFRMKNKRKAGEINENEMKQVCNAVFCPCVIMSLCERLKGAKK